MDKNGKHFKRLFIAVRIEPDIPLLNWFKQVKETLKNEEIRWTRLENLHLTLLFLGDTNIELIPEISTALERSTVSYQYFRFSLSGLGVFRSLSYPRVLWIGIKETEKLGLIKESIDNQLKPLLNKDVTGSFKPHLTLGRMKRIENLELLKELISKYRDNKFMEVEIDEIILYESILNKSGPVYKVIKTIPLSQ
jgi:2'-5' RNA ligase